MVPGEPFRKDFYRDMAAGSPILTRRGMMGTLNAIRDRLEGSLAVSVRAGTVEAIVGTITYQKRLGTIGEVATVQSIGTLKDITRLGTVKYAGRLGTLGYQPRLGTLGYLGRTGTVGYTRRLGTISHLGTFAARLFSSLGAGFGIGTHVARGSWYSGSWVDVSRFLTKTLVIHPSSLSGTIHIMASVLGQATEHGTYYSSRVGKGSYTTKSFTETLKEVRAIFEASGSSVTGKGTIRAEWGLQV